MNDTTFQGDGKVAYVPVVVNTKLKKPITNADRIRSMTDEELADWLGVYCNGQTAQEVGKPCVSGMGSCEDCWLDWLRQEAKDA